MTLVLEVWQSAGSEMALHVAGALRTEVGS